MTKLIASFLLILLSSALFAQRQTLRGIVVDENGTPLSYVSAALLYPKDSTLAFFGISSDDGSFEIKNVTSGEYMLQLALIGYQTHVVRLTIPLPAGDDLGAFVLQRNPISLGEVEVKAERIPLQLKGDTVEYNAGAFKTQPDASVEDLLKKLPGVEVDQAGNIRAQGEDVNQVLVDGKEFFSSDPKVATKNLPADGVDKVQVFDKTSDEADFTGIDDGSRSKTINLLLKDDKKSAWMGDAQAGIGTGDHYQANAKVFRFTHTTQFAALGMLNNINQFGFSFNDYIDFNGGIGSMMSGGRGIRIEAGDDLPINFGQQINGLITSGAAGLNFTYEAKPGNRINVSYLGNGYDKNLTQETSTENFTPDYSFRTDDTSEQNTKSLANRINFNFRNKPDSMQSIFANGSIGLTGGKLASTSFSESFSSDVLTNSLEDETFEQSNGLRGNADVSYVHKGRSDWRVFKLDASLSAKSTLTESEWNTLTQYFDTGESILANQFKDDRNKEADYEGGFSAYRKISDSYYLVPSVRLGGINEVLNRDQGLISIDDQPVDSLSPDFSRSDYWVQPGLSLRNSSKKTQWRLLMAVRNISLQNSLNGEAEEGKNYFYLTPQFSLEKELTPGQHLRVVYESRVNAPTATQLLPVTDNTNPLELYTGNRDLKPEYSHNLNGHWVWFDQFSFTSLFANANLGYTKDKINYSKTINDDLTQSITLVNVKNDYTANASFELSTPMRFIGLNIHAGINESYARGINYVNAIENIVDGLSHEFTLSFDNRKKEKVDASFGGQVEFSNAKYSVQSALNNRYFNWSYFVEIGYTPASRWHFSFNADVNHYSDAGGGVAAYIPLLQATIDRYLLKSNRGVITLKGFDLLDQNSGFTQTSDFNYFQQQQSNTIGRYVMLSFKYRFNKFDSGNGGVDVKVNGR